MVAPEEHEGGAGAPLVADALAEPDLSHHALQFREWLVQSIEPGMVVSARSAEDGEFRLFQVLERPRRMITVKSYDFDETSSSLWSVSR